MIRRDRVFQISHKLDDVRAYFNEHEDENAPSRIPYLLQMALQKRFVVSLISASSHLLIPGTSSKRYFYAYGRRPADAIGAFLRSYVKRVLTLKIVK